MCECGACLCIFARRREEVGESGAKFTDLLFGRGVAGGEGEGEAVEGVRGVCAGGPVSGVLGECVELAEMVGDGGKQGGSGGMVKTHPPRHRDCDRDRDDRELDHAAALRRGEEQLGAEGNTGARHLLSLLQLRLMEEDEIALHSHCHLRPAGRGTGHGL